MVTTILHTATRKLKTFILSALEQKEQGQYFPQEVHILYQIALHFDLEILFLDVFGGEEYTTGVGGMHCQLLSQHLHRLWLIPTAQMRIVKTTKGRRCERECLEVE